MTTLNEFIIKMMVIVVMMMLTMMRIVDGDNADIMVKMMLMIGNHIGIFLTMNKKARPQVPRGSTVDFPENVLWQPRARPGARRMGSRTELATPYDCRYGTRDL